jgi:molybdate transport system ATP-binding protein
MDAEVRAGRLLLHFQFACNADTMGVYGPSGAGKTTLLRALAGLVRPEAGRIVVGEHVLFDSDAGVDVPIRHRGVGVVFQEDLLFPHLSVKRNLEYGLRRTPAGQRRVRPEQIIRLLELSPLLRRSTRDLSGGERKRVAIGRALLRSPRLLLLDEPLSGLDPARSRRVLCYLRTLQRELRIPTVLVSHALDDILFLTDTVLHIETHQPALRTHAAVQNRRRLAI